MVLSTKTREKMRQAKLGRKLTDSHRAAISLALAGKPKSAEHVAKLSGENSHSWRGDNVGYQGVHIWVRKELGKPKGCEVCKTTEDRMYHWANVSGEYKRDISDWKRMCVSCHRKFDYTDEQRRKNSESKKGNTYRRISVAQYEVGGSELHRYPSVRQASQLTGILATSIINNTTGRSKSAGGYVWRKV